MENLNLKIDTIYAKVAKLKATYLELKDDHQKLEVQLSNLKVEADHYKTEYLKLKKEQEEIVEGDIKTTLSTSNDSKHILTNAISPNVSGDAKEAIKLKLDEFIEDIDQCIQIIQNK